MTTQQVSVPELREYWKAVAKDEGGNVAVIPMWRMPPWKDICTELSWDKHVLGDNYFGKKFHGYCGVYRLIGLATEGGLKHPASLNRVCGQDTTGTLYIGKASRLNERLNDLRRSTHNAIVNLNRIPLKTLFPSDKLAVALLALLWQIWLKAACEQPLTVRAS